MFRNAVPRIDRELSREHRLSRRCEVLFWNRYLRNWHERRQPLGPLDRRILDRHSLRIGLQLNHEIQVDIRLRKRLGQRLAQPVVRRIPRDLRLPLRTRV